MACISRIIIFIIAASCITIEEPPIDIPAPQELPTPPIESCYMTDKKMLCVINNSETCLYWDDVECVKGVFESCAWYIDVDLWIKVFANRRTPDE